MPGDASVYGDRWAEVYDDWHGDARAIAAGEEIAETLAELAGSGPALELGIGTGRVALPLAARGVEVHGVDASEEMLAKLRAKPGGDAIPVVVGDFADVPVEGAFRLIFVVFNTLFALPSPGAQARCFVNLVDHLAEGGVFVVEAFVPDPSRFDRGQRTSTLAADADRLVLEGATHDPVEQRVRSTFAVIRESGTELLPVEIRYAWPAELDQMARAAGLELKERWGGWDRHPFTAASTGHVSVYGRP